MSASARFRNYALLRAAIRRRVYYTKSRRVERLTGHGWLVDLWPTTRQSNPKVFTLASLYVDSTWRGRGLGGKILRTVCAAADELGFTLRLRAKPYGATPGLDHDTLVEWYADHGFVKERQNPRFMRRRPAKLARFRRAA